MSEALQRNPRDARGRVIVRVVPSDPVFDSWVGGVQPTSEALLWARQGMGALVVDDLPYDEAYFAKYQKMNLTNQGRRITEARVDLVARHAGGASHVLDVGIGSGAFIMGRAGWTYGYDINPAGVLWLKERGRWKDPYEKPFPAASLWDVLEHIPQPKRLLDNVKRWVFMSCPIWPGDGAPSRDWKHYKSNEHCWYWTKDGLVAWMREHGFECREATAVETTLGREDIGTFAFERRTE